MTINKLIQELKDNNEDFEFYPTTKEMLEIIFPFINNCTVLDIGCGTCNFKKYFEEYAEKQAEDYNRSKEFEKLEKLKNGENYHYYPKDKSDFYGIKKYYVMEKSKILLNNLDADTICLGTDFNHQTLIDKKVDVIFCNPPYSEFTEWLHKIISEGNFLQAFLILPQRWEKNIETINLLKYHKTNYQVLGLFDFLDAERKARGKVNVIRLVKEKFKDMSYYSCSKQEHFEPDAFDAFFNNTFNISNNTSEDKCESDYQRVRNKEEKHSNLVKEALRTQEGSKAEILVNLYQEELQTLMKHLELIMQLDEKVLETFGLNIEKIKAGLKVHISGLKDFYWKKVFDEMEEITSRLTYASRESLYNSFEELKILDFTLDNIYALIVWVIKNANKYFNEQLVDFFKKLSDVENVIPYKSNQKLFNKEEWRWSRDKRNHYVLDYRIIMSSPFRTTWSGQLDTDCFAANRTLSDIKTIANNLGFEILSWNKYPNTFGEKVYIYNKVGTDAFMEYKVYKNGNMHVKFNKEFTKAMNVEVSRILGWIKTKEDIAKEFPEELAKGAEKYFYANNCISLENNRFLLLEKKAS